MNKKEKAAKIIRAITVPPVLVFMLLITLFLGKDAVFTDYKQLILSIVFLMLLPVFAYPLALIIPQYKKKGREGQRDLAFILSAIGYFSAAVYGFIANVNQGLTIIFLTYFLSAITLSVFNKIIKLRASGHACSITGPLILMIYFIGWKCTIPCLILFTLIIWSSLTLRRHTLRDLITGSCTAIIAFLITLLITLV